MSYYKAYKSRCKNCGSKITDTKSKEWICLEIDEQCKDIDWCPYNQGNY